MESNQNSQEQKWEHNRHYPFHNRHHRRYHGMGHIMLASILIIVGCVFLGRNLGFINDYIFHIIISWQMLLIAIGTCSLIWRNFVAGLIMASIGIYFLIPHITGSGIASLHTYWPVLLIVIGIISLTGVVSRRFFWKKYGKYNYGRHHSDKVEDGFVTIDMSFGSTNHIVLDPVFKGADIDVSFGSALLDLRNTTLDAPETCIDIDVSFGGVELRIPNKWYIVVKCDNSFGGIEDRRRMSDNIDYEHKVIIRGDVSFSGIEIKD